MVNVDAMGKADAGFYLALLTAGVYLVVRGLDNIYLGLTKEPIDPLASWLGRKIEKIANTQEEVGEESTQTSPSQP